MKSYLAINELNKKENISDKLTVFATYCDMYLDQDITNLDMNLLQAINHASEKYKISPSVIYSNLLTFVDKKDIKEHSIPRTVTRVCWIPIGIGISNSVTVTVTKSVTVSVPNETESRTPRRIGNLVFHGKPIIEHWSRDGGEFGWELVMMDLKTGTEKRGLESHMEIRHDRIEASIQSKKEPV